MEIKYVNELTIMKIIQKINEISPIDYIYFEREYMDKINILRKEYTVKFEGEEEEYFINLTDYPFKLDGGIAGYDVLFQTKTGRYFAHNNTKLNMIYIDFSYGTMALYMSEYQKRRTKEISSKND